MKHTDAIEVAMGGTQDCERRSQVESVLPAGGGAKQLLFVYPYAFAYGWSGETPRLMQVAHGLSRHDWEVSLLRCRQPSEPRTQPLIRAFPGRVRTAPFNGIYPALFNRRGFRQLFDLWQHCRGRKTDQDSTEIASARLLRFAIDSALPTPSLVWGITVGHLVGPVAAQQLSQHFRCPFVVEFRDPVPHPGHAPLSPSRRLLLENCLRGSSLVIATTEGIAQKIQDDFPLVRDRVRTVYSGYDEAGAPAVSVQKRPTDPLVLVHAGVLYGGHGRNARSLVQGIAEAVKLEGSLRQRVQLRLIGAGEGGIEAAALAQELGIPWGVELCPHMTLQACLNEMDRADVLVAIKFDAPAYDLQVPGKIFQYLGRGKPILGLMRETEAARILRRSGLGIIRPNTDVAGIAAALLDLWQHRHSLAERFSPDWDYIRQFSVRALAGSLDRELTRITHERAIGWHCRSGL